MCRRVVIYICVCMYVDRPPLSIHYNLLKTLLSKGGSVRWVWVDGSVFVWLAEDHHHLSAII